MPVAQLYQHGLTIGTAPAHNAHVRGLRSTVGGWSSGSCRRNTAFLRSVLDADLTGLGFTFTLTVRDCPPDARTFHRLRKAYLMRLTRGGAVRVHWVIEWQRRGVPHLHGLAYSPTGGDVNEAARSLPLHSWLDIAEPFGAQVGGQHFRVIHDAVGWMKYLAKHASRGVGHYQRSPENVPKAWQGQTGRVWGYGGQWPRRDPIRLEFEQPTAWQLRRMIRGWRVADARSDPNPQARRHRMVAARRMLSCNDRRLSSVRGISEWLSPRVFDLMLEALHREGHTIEHG